MRIIIICRFHTFLHWLIMVSLSWILYMLFVIIVDGGSSYNSFATMYVAFSGGKFYFNFILIVGTCCIIDLFTSSCEILFGKNLKSQLMILVKERSTLNNKTDLPKNILNLLTKAEGGVVLEEPDNNYQQIEDSSPGRKQTKIIKIGNPKANETDLDKVDGVNVRIELSDRTRNRLNIESEMGASKLD
jgi:hypothetical protein